MLNLKKTAVAVLAFSSSAVFAGTMGPVCAPGNVTVPCESTAWDFGVQALYLQPSFDSDYGNYYNLADDTIYDHNHRFHGSENWGWGFQLEGSYHFNTGNDVNLNWYHYNDSRNHHDDHDEWTFLDSSDHHRNRVRPQWDAVNLEFGQHVDFSQWTKIRFHAGAQYARIKTSFGRRDSVWGSHEEAFNGFGPRVGMDAAYEVGNGFAFYGKAATTLLAGSTKFESRYLNTTVHWNNSRTQVVPELEGKLGARYTYAMASGDLTLDVGYMWVDYINVRDVFNFTSLVANKDDFGLSGVYAGLKWVGNVA
jgi:hypothetical protein